MIRETSSPFLLTSYHLRTIARTTMTKTSMILSKTTVLSAIIYNPSSNAVTEAFTKSRAPPVPASFASAQHVLFPGSTNAQSSLASNVPLSRRITPQKPRTPTPPPSPTVLALKRPNGRMLRTSKKSRRFEFSAGSDDEALSLLLHLRPCLRYVLRLLLLDLQLV